MICLILRYSDLGCVWQRETKCPDKTTSSVKSSKLSECVSDTGTTASKQDTAGSPCWDVRKTQKGFWAAEADCVRSGGHLAKILSEEQNSLFVRMCERQQTGDNVYFGYADSDGDTETNFRWLDGTESAYTSWKKGQPNGNNKKGEEHVVEMEIKKGEWTDEKHVEKERDYVCELPRSDGEVCHSDWERTDWHPCQTGFYKVESGDQGCMSCPPFSTTARTESTSLSDCKCIDGYKGSASDCVQCSADSYCSGGTEQHCPAHTTALAGSSSSTDCKCLPAFYHAPYSEFSTDRSSCVDCPVDHFCQGGDNAPEACPAKTESPAQSSSQDQCVPGAELVCPSNAFPNADASTCVCGSGFYGPDMGPCAQCEAAFYCPGGNTAASCPHGSTSPIGSEDVSACVCDPGTFTSDGVCVACLSGSYCVDDSLNACPEHTQSAAGSAVITACVCKDGYKGSRGSACTLCSDPAVYCKDGIEHACPANKVVASVPGSEIGQCVADKGHELDYVGNAVECKLGTYKEVPGNFACRSCGAIQPRAAAQTGARQVMDGLIGYWPLATDFEDKSGNENHLSNYQNGIDGGVSFRTDDEFAPFSDGFAFFDPPMEDAAGLSSSKRVWREQRVHALCVDGFDPHTNENGGAYTWELWWSPQGLRRTDVKDDWPLGNHWAVSYAMGDGRPSNDFSMSSGKGVASDFYGCDAGRNGKFDGPEVPAACTADEKWHHLAFVATPGVEAILYFDGIEIQRGAYNEDTMQRGGALALGAEQDSKCGRWDYRQTLKGGMTEVRFWNVARTEQQIRAVIRAGAFTESFGSTSPLQCVCQPGSFGDAGGPCTECSVGKWCDGGIENACPANAASLFVGALARSDCKCNAGYFGPAGGPCALCQAGEYCAGGANVATQCPENSESGAGSSQVTDCVCRSGFNGNPGGPCEVCMRGSVCSGGGVEPCPENSESLSGSIDVSSCKCLAGFYGADGGACAECAADSYCPGGPSITSCPTHASSPAGSKSVEACVCNGGYYQAADGSCSMCTAGSYCNGDEEKTCPQNANSVSGASSRAACVCSDGFRGAAGSDCTACIAGTYCSDGVESTCPPHTTSAAQSRSAADCLPVEGYYSSGGSVIPCAVGTYKDSVGDTACIACTTGASTSMTGSTSVMQCSCSNGYYGPAGGSCTECGVGKWCASGVENACPSNAATLIAGSSLASECACVPGFVGNPSGKCNQCMPNHFCPGGDVKTRCEQHSRSNAGSSSASDCVCADGFHGANGGQCAECAANSYCSDGIKTVCPANSNSRSGSSASVACTCNAGFHGDPGAICTSCPGSSYCPGGSAVQTCPASSTSPSGSISKAACACNIGFFKVADGSCYECLVGGYCNNDDLNQCPDHTSSPRGSDQLSDCSCMDGYQGPVGEACAICPRSTFCTNGALSNCPANTTSPAASDSVVDCVPVKGFYFDRDHAVAQCPIATYKHTVGDTPCITCGTGATTSKTGRTDKIQCVCEAGFYGPPGGPCTECSVGKWCSQAVENACPVNAATLAVGASVITDCVCNAGYAGPNGDSCKPCAVGMWCPGGDNVTSCPADSSSVVGSETLSDCICKPGYQGNPGGPCSVCPVNGFCESGMLIACPANSQSGAGSSSVSDCACQPGFAGPNGGACSACVAGSYCPGGSSVVQCPTHASSSVQSDSIESCVCADGYFEGAGGTDCQACPAGSWCALDSQNACPDNTNSPALSSSIAACVCNGGFFGDAGTACASCSVGTYCSGGEIHFCGEHTTSPAESSMLSHCVPIEGYEEVLGSVLPCPVGEYKDSAGNTACLTCPSGSSTSSQGSTSRMQCKCVPGFKGPAGGPCAVCDVGSWCDAGVQRSCPMHSATFAAGSSMVKNCTCLAGFVGRDGGPCSACAADHYCTGGNTETKCVPDSQAKAGSDALSDCTCVPGHYGNAIWVTNPCSLCPADSYCAGASAISSCPANALSPAGSIEAADCGCEAGFYGANGQACSECPQNWYGFSPSVLTSMSLNRSVLFRTAFCCYQPACTLDDSGY